MTNSSRSKSLDARITSVRSADTFALRCLDGGGLINSRCLRGSCARGSVSPQSRASGATKFHGKPASSELTRGRSDLLFIFRAATSSALGTPSRLIERDNPLSRRATVLCGSA
jgi:hypothetical protein